MKHIVYLYNIGKPIFININNFDVRSIREKLMEGGGRMLVLLNNLQQLSYINKKNTSKRRLILSFNSYLDLVGSSNTGWYLNLRPLKWKTMILPVRFDVAIRYKIKHKFFNLPSTIEGL